MSQLGQGLQIIAPYLIGVALTSVLISIVAFLTRHRVVAWATAASAEGDPLDTLSKMSLLVAIALLGVNIAVEFLGTLGFWLGFGLSPAHLPLAAALTALGVWAASKSLFRRPRVVTAAVLSLAAVSLVALTVLAGHTYDISWDGNTAQQVAVVRLADGWNPVRDPHVPPSEARQWAAAEFYPKGPWIREASVYLLTGHLEQAKVANLSLIVASFALWLSLLLEKLRGRPWWAFGAAALIALNPISVVQALTFLVDGQVASLFAIVLAAGLLLFTRLGRWPTLIAFAAGAIMLTTTKFTGLVYAVEVSVAVCAVAAYRPGILKPKRLAAALAATMLLAIIFFGFNPYAVNTYLHGFPFYPVVGPGAGDLISNNQPVDFAGEGNLERLARSLFSKASDDIGQPTELKIPFSVYASEVRPYLAPQVRIAGFGPWFSGSLVLAAALLLAYLVRRTRRRPWPLWAVAGAALVVITVLSNPEAWWARYAPQLWIAPILVAVAAAGESRRAIRFVGLAILVTILVDCAFVSAIGLGNVVNARMEIDAALGQAQQWDKPVLLQQREFETSWIKLQERGIDYEIVSDETTRTGGLTIPYTTATMYASP